MAQISVLEHKDTEVQISVMDTGEAEAESQITVL